MRFPYYLASLRNQSENKFRTAEEFLSEDVHKILKWRQEISVKFSEINNLGKEMKNTFCLNN